MCEESEDTIFDIVKKWSLKISPTNFPHAKTEERKPANNLTIKCGDCIFKCEGNPKLTLAG